MSTCPCFRMIMMASNTQLDTKDPKAAQQQKLVVPMTALGTLVAASATAVLARRPSNVVAPNRLVEMSVATVGGLLSSSCCVLQLVLNSLSIGCAGFAVLDRFRPFFLALTFSSLAFKTWYFDVRLKRTVWRSIPTWIVALALAFSPHAVKFINRAAASSASRQPQVYRLDVKGMKCEACANGLKRELDQLPGVRVSSVFFSDGRVEVEGDGHGDGGALLDRIGAVMERRQYESVLLDDKEARPPADNARMAA